MTIANTAIHVEDLWHSYLRETPFESSALSGLNMDVNAGEVVGIVGPTGSGKSTLVQHFNGLIRPQQGKVVVAGIDLSDSQADMKAIRQKVGMFFQFAEQQLFETYVGDDVAFGPKNMGLRREKIRERVRYGLEAVGLGFGEFKDRPIFTLSGGEKRKVAMAGVLALRPDILVMDEPTAGLDPRSRKELLARVLELNRSEGLTVILVTHNMEEVASVAERIFVLQNGQVALSGSPHLIFGQAALYLKSLGLSVPPITRVMNELSARGMRVRSDVVTVAEAEEEIWKSLTSFEM